MIRSDGVADGSQDREIELEDEALEIAAGGLSAPGQPVIPTNSTYEYNPSPLQLFEMEGLGNLPPSEVF